jgi:uncharacterized protein (DUF305 family)
MRQSLPRLTSILAAAGLAACASGSKGPVATGVAPAAGHHSTTAAAVRADTGRFAYTQADVDFMTGMIAHHAQAVLMAGWAPTHGASQSVRSLCERIVVGQHDEIVLMQHWLRDRQQKVPDGDASHDMMPDMPGMDHGMLMPGMLSAEQLMELNQARGPDFDRLFLRYMIMHHNGAITMVNQLFGSQGAGEEEMVYRFASDVYADQTTEIDRMQKMLLTLASGGRSQ